MAKNKKQIKKPKKQELKIDFADELIAGRKQGTGKMPKNMPRWMSFLITKIDTFSKKTGEIVCWITMPLIFAMVYEVVARKFFFSSNCLGIRYEQIFIWGFIYIGFSLCFIKRHSHKSRFFIQKFYNESTRANRYYSIFNFLFSRSYFLFLYDKRFCPRIYHEG